MTPGEAILIGGDPTMNHSDWRHKQTNNDFFLTIFLAPLILAAPFGLC